MFGVTSVLQFPSKLHTDSYIALLFPSDNTPFLCLEKNALCSSAATVFPCRKGSISKAGEAFLPLVRVEILCAHILLGGKNCKTSGKTCHLAYEKLLVHSLWVCVHYKTTSYPILPGSVTPSGTQFVLFKLLAYLDTAISSLGLESLSYSFFYLRAWFDLTLLKCLLTIYFFQFLSRSHSVFGVIKEDTSSFYIQLSKLGCYVLDGQTTR